MIAAMQQSWSATIEQLAELDRRQDFAALGQALQQLPADCPDDHRAAITHWRGKAALMVGKLEEALPELAVAAQLDPQRAANHYLLGAALVRQQQWLDARAALTRALQLQPALGAARLELATVLLALAEPQQALELLQPLPDTADGPYRARRAQAAVKAAAEPMAAAALAAKALSLDSRLPESLLLEWLQGAGGLLLAHRFQESRAWLTALITLTPSVKSTANPVPRRIALIALLALELIEPTTPDLDPWLAELSSLRWLPPSATEHNLWRSWLESWLMLVAGRLEDQLDRHQKRCGCVLVEILAVLPQLQPPRQKVSGLFHRLQLLRQGIQPDQVGPDAQLELALQRHNHDWLALIGWLKRCCALDDRALRKLRPELERQLQNFSGALLSRPQLLCRLPDPGLLQAALQLRQRGLEQLIRCRERLQACSESLPQRSGPHRHWLLLASNDLPQCVLYRVDQKRQQLEALGCLVGIIQREQLEHWDWSESLLWADAVIVCRLPATVQVLRAIEACRLAGLPTWYDMDDLVIDPEHGVPPLASYGGTITALHHRWLQLDVPLFAAAMRACDAVIVSTPTLARRWNQLQPDQPVQVLANLAPPPLQKALRAPRRVARRPRLLVASGTKAHKQIWIEELAPALSQLLERNPALQLDLLGHLELPLVLLPHRERIRCHPFSDYPTYLNRIAEADIGLVALEPGLYTDAKSAIRWMEFSYLGLASVLSPTRTYTECLQEGVHACFARGIDSWVDTVEQLLADPRGTRAMAVRAQRRAQELFGPHQAEAFWTPLVQPPAAQASALAAPQRRRLLVLNVYFAPQSVGGATRIAQDQVRAIQEQLGDQWEVTVLCTESASWQEDLDREPADPSKPRKVWQIEQPLPIQVHQWQGARVVRLTLPPRSWSRHHDVSVEAFCRRWFAAERFDLVHAHCIQELGIGPLTVARDLGIPYVVTLHDGWWLSPRQFLTTPSGRPVDVRDPLGHIEVMAAFDAEEQQQDRQRRTELEQVLAGAAARLAVSQAFAATHEQAGINDVSVMENRWQPMPAVGPRSPRPADQPLRCCFIGGLAIHKGIHVVQAACLQARPVAPGIELTVIDSSLETDEEQWMQWGETSVCVIPPVPMAAMAAFYAEQDVLLAPSIWPESYGLVSREALSAGLWVVASDIGAMADPIRHGENGHRVPAGDASALAAVLEQLAAEHPTPQPLLAFASDQKPLHQELDQLYRSVLRR
ncbi:putative alpha-glycosyltransferase/ family 4 [Synechococcus sp. A18-46.1]|nr:putative alpha-glycosyltransferase/ family 4 [Synechococcus sp. A18-46.1]